MAAHGSRGVLDLSPVIGENDEQSGIHRISRVENGIFPSAILESRGMGMGMGREHRFDR